MKNFDWEEFKTKPFIYVHCGTQRKTFDFLSKCRENGIAFDTYEDEEKSDLYGDMCYYSACLNRLHANLFGSYFKFETKHLASYKIIEWEIEMTNAEKILDIIGLKVEEKFKLKNSDLIYYFDEELMLLIEGNNIFSCRNIGVLNGTEKIIKLPAITDNDKEILNFYSKRGYKWFACDKDGEHGAYKKQPYRIGDCEYSVDNWMAKHIELPEPLSFLKWEDKPFYWECE